MRRDGRGGATPAPQAFPPRRPFEPVRIWIAHSWRTTSVGLYWTSPSRLSPDVPTAATARATSAPPSYPKTVDLLKDELTRTRARNAAIKSGHYGADIRIDGLPKVNARTPRFAGVWATIPQPTSVYSCNLTNLS